MGLADVDHIQTLIDGKQGKKRLCAQPIEEGCKINDWRSRLKKGVGHH